MSVLGTPINKLTSLYVCNVHELLQHELDRLNAIKDEDLSPSSLQQRKVMNEVGIDERFKYADVAFGLLSNGYFLNAISSAAYVDTYDRETGEATARKRLDDLVWEMNAFAVKNEAAEEHTTDTHHPVYDTWQQTSPRVMVTQGMGDENNSPFTIPLNLGHTLGWIHGVENISDQYKDITLAVGVLPNGFVLIGAHQAYSHGTYNSTQGVLCALNDLEQQCLKYRFFVAKATQHHLERLDTIEKALNNFEPIPPSNDL